MYLGGPSTLLCRDWERCLCTRIGRRRAARATRGSYLDDAVEMRPASVFSGAHALRPVSQARPACRQLDSPLGSRTRTSARQWLRSGCQWLLLPGSQSIRRPNAQSIGELACKEAIAGDSHIPDAWRVCRSPPHWPWAADMANETGETRRRIG